MPSTLTPQPPTPSPPNQLPPITAPDLPCDVSRPAPPIVPHLAITSPNCLYDALRQPLPTTATTPTMHFHFAATGEIFSESAAPTADRIAGNPINSVDPSGEARVIIAFEGLTHYSENRARKGDTGASILLFLRNAGVDAFKGPRVDVDSNKDIVLYSDYNAFQESVDLIKSEHLDQPYKTKSGECRYNTFVAVGHSLGGGGAWAFSHKVLEQLHFKINLGFTLDPRDAFNPPTDDEGNNAPWKRADWGWNTLAASNWINFYRTIRVPLAMGGYELPPGPGMVNNPIANGIVTHDGLLSYAPAITDFKTAINSVGYFQDKLPQ